MALEICFNVIYCKAAQRTNTTREDDVVVKDRMNSIKEEVESKKTHAHVGRVRVDILGVAHPEIFHTSIQINFGDEDKG